MASPAGSGLRNRLRGRARRSAAARFPGNRSRQRRTGPGQFKDGRGQTADRHRHRQAPRGGFHTGPDRYGLAFRLNREVPRNLGVQFGAGEAHLDVGGLTVRNLEVEMGVGQLDLDLRGTPKQSYDVRIRGGVGEAVVHLPSEVGVEAEAQGGLGSVQASGLRHDGNRYYNDAWENSKIRIHLDIQGGVGSIRLLAE